ncbi:MAG: hypothetical protein AB1714_17685 [Acidobacteriota bacterium]
MSEPGEHELIMRQTSLGFRAYRILSPEAWGGFVAEVTFGGWVVIALAWWRSSVFHRSLAVDTGAD